MNHAWILPAVILAFLFACDGKKGEEAKQPEAAAAKGKAQPAAAAKPASPAQQLLDQAIAARGGLAKLKAASKWTGLSKGMYMGVAYQARTFFQEGKSRMDVLDPAGQPAMSMAWSMDACWNKMGPVVMPCDKVSIEETKVMIAMHRAFELYPLKQKGWQLELGKEKLDEKEFSTLKVSHKGHGVAGTLFIEPASKQVMRMVYQGSMMGQKGEYVLSVEEYQDHCGIKMPAKSATTFGGQPYLSEEFTEIKCELADASVFAQPAQVADGTFVEKVTPPGVVACTRHKGPYQKMSGAIGKLMAFTGKQNLSPMGPPIMTYLKAPPKVRKPKKFVTEICLPVAAPAPKRPQKKGKFVIKSVKPKNVLAVYGIGDYATKSGEMVKLLIKEVKKRKLKAKGAMSQISYMKPGDVPAEQLVSEMQIPIKAKKGKKKAK